MRGAGEHLEQSINRVRDEPGGRLAHVERRLGLLEDRFIAFGFELAGIGKSLIAGTADSEMSAVQRSESRCCRHEPADFFQRGG